MTPSLKTLPTTPSPQATTLRTSIPYTWKPSHSQYFPKMNKFLTRRQFSTALRARAPTPNQHNARVEKAAGAAAQARNEGDSASQAMKKGAGAAAEVGFYITSPLLPSPFSPLLLLTLACLTLDIVA